MNICFDSRYSCDISQEAGCKQVLGHSEHQPFPHHSYALMVTKCHQSTGFRIPITIRTH